ncbi:disease resistance RPP13-like protein 4 [Prunus avium]|uniref:Disease resistance RPP13-like protein 4 n=1 Tax=Prunus avium TaxID=42229 RepID=A0A6P5T2P2_PRUAV|nr:disease resistance RPP13-like protein 4 [Prunus avium]XP_021820744.1 disease resistance RPP13-like protein 4 [Prunus avium]
MAASINPEKFMAKLLDLLSKAKDLTTTEGEAVRNIETNLQRVKKEDFLARVKLFDQTVLKQFTAVERRLGKIILPDETPNPDINATKEALDLIDKDVQKIIDDLSLLKECMPSPERISESHFHRFKPDQSGLAQKMSEDWSQLDLENRIDESNAIAKIRRTYDDLENLELKMCFLSFSIFPDGSKIKKRPLIYWWIGEGFIKSTPEKTAEEVGEEIFEKLITRGFINGTYSNASSRAVVIDCTIHPWIRRMLISLASKAGLFNFGSRGMSTCRRACLVFDPTDTQGDAGLKVDDLLTVFNVNVLYLNLKKEWLSKLNKVAVLQLGQWQNSTKYHIELEDEGSLKGLRAQKHLKYLSFRGISRITELPSSIFRLTSLEILDLRACHNLEKLPPDISSLKNLTHLDLSECYLLEGMPKGLEKLSSLQVLKGFLIGSKKNTPCRPGELAKLTNLKRLSIHIGNEAVVEEKEFKNFKNILSLRRLKISWGVVSKKLKDKIEECMEFSFPPDLEKLDLQGI